MIVGLLKAMIGLLKTIASLLEKLIFTLADLGNEGIAGVMGNFINGTKLILQELANVSYEMMLCFIVLGGFIYMTGHTSLGKKFCRKSFWGWTFLNFINLIVQNL